MVFDEESTIASWLGSVVQALLASVDGVSPLQDVLVDRYSSVGLCLFGVCMFRDASFLFPYASCLFPCASCLFPYVSFLFPYASFLFPYASCVIG